MRSYFFSADTQEDMLGWVRALSQSAIMEPDSSLNRYGAIHFGYEVFYSENQTFFMIALGELFFCCISDPFRRCSSYQDFTQIGGSSESVDFPKPPSDGEGPSQKHRHVSRTLSEPSHLTSGRMGTSHSEHRGRRSVRQRNSRLSSHLCV